MKNHKINDSDDKSDESILFKRNKKRSLRNELYNLSLKEDDNKWMNTQENLIYDALNNEFIKSDQSLNNEAYDMLDRDKYKADSQHNTLHLPNLSYDLLNRSSPNLYATPGSLQRSGNGNDSLHNNVDYADVGSFDYAKVNLDYKTPKNESKKIEKPSSYNYINYNYAPHIDAADILEKDPKQKKKQK